MAFDEGIFINPVIPPACAPQDTLVRVALMATHTKEQVDYAVEKLTKCFKELGIIKQKSICKKLYEVGCPVTGQPTFCSRE